MELVQIHYDLTTLRQPLVSLHDPLLRYADDHAGRRGPLTLYYDSTPFQGTTFEQTEASIILTQYENGLMNGKEFVFDEQGKCRKIWLYEDGDDIGEQSWHENGKMKEDSRRGIGNKFWNERGILVHERRIINAESATVADYYDNGSIKSYFQTGIPERQYTIFYFRDGSEIYKEHWTEGSCKKYLEYHHENLLSWYKELFSSSLQPDDVFTSEKERQDFFYGWLGELAKTDDEVRTEVLRYFSDYSIYP